MLLRFRRMAATAAVLSPFCSPLFAQTAAGPHFIPLPRSVSLKADVPLKGGVTVVCTGCDADDQFAASELRQTLAERHIPAGAGLRIVLQRLAQHPDATFTEPMRAEGYTIVSTPGTLTLTGATAEGVFYAAQTAKQMIEGNAATGYVLHQADIRDWPAMKYRGMHDDLSRGPVDTLEFQKKLIRTLAAYKVNLYSPYFEHTQQYSFNALPAPPGGSMSADDARELVAYARPYHITVVPEQEAFGHLRHVLVWENYASLAETPHGAVLAPGQPGSVDVIQKMFGELAQLYPGPFLHIGADETEDLGEGQTKAAVDAQGLGPVYLDFMQRIDTALRPLHRRLLFWGDIAQKSPDLLKAMPADFKRDTIAIAWEYNPNPHGFAKYLKPYTEAGFETWVASGINNWNRVYPNYNNGLENIQEFTRDGQAMGATGQLNTLWNDDGEALASNNWYGLLFGAAAAWQQGESSIPAFQSSFAQVFHGDRTGKINQAQEELMAAHELLHSTKVGDGSDGLFWIDPWSPDGMKMAAQVRPVLTELRNHAERALQLIAEARAAAPAPATPIVYSQANWLPSNPTSLRETDAIDALELGARRFDLIGMKFQMADEMAAIYADAQSKAPSTDRKTHLRAGAELHTIGGVNGRVQDIRDTYALIRDLYAQTWLRTTRPYALRPVLEHYDSTIALWQDRADKVRSAQRQFAEDGTLPPAATVGIPAPVTPAVVANRN